MAELETILSYVLTAFGGGSVGAIVKVIADRRVQSVEDEETSARLFRTELREEIRELRQMHNQCQEDRLTDRTELAHLRGQVQLLTGRLTITMRTNPPEQQPLGNTYWQPEPPEKPKEGA